MAHCKNCNSLTDYGEILCNDCLIDSGDKDSLLLSIQILEKQISNRNKAINILLEYWDSLPDEDKPKIDERLRNLGI